MLFLPLLLFALLPGFAWLFFYLKEDPEREPPGYLALTFILGGLAAIVAFALQLILYKSGLAAPLQATQTSWPFLLSLLLLSASEEIIKFLTAWLAVKPNPGFKPPIDAMIYPVVAALGFATLENLGSVFGAGGKLLLWNAFFTTLTLRFLGATMLHSLTSGIAGYWWALGFRHRRQMLYVTAGLAIAIVLHATFNWLILTYGNLVFSLLFLMIVALFVLRDFEKLKHQAPRP